MGEQVVVTGMGAVSALGLSLGETWQGLLAGRSGVAPIATFDTTGFAVRIAAAVPGFEALEFLGRREARRACRFTQLATAAALEALSQARLDLAVEDRTRAGVAIGSAVGGIGATEEQALNLARHGVHRVNPVLLPMVIVNAAACHLAVHLGLAGPAEAPAAACASGLVALGTALGWLQRGEVDVMLAGGADAPVTPLTLAGFTRLGALSARNDDPAHACRPFDAARDGTVLGEGAAVLVLETAGRAARRGAEPLAAVLGYGASQDAFHMTAPEPQGAGVMRAMAMALRDAGLDPAAVEYVVAHGTGTPLNDVVEAHAIHTLFGARAHQIPVGANKGALGHTLGAAGALSAVAAIQAMREGLLPPTANLETPDPACDLDHVLARPRPARVRTALVNAMGFGGQNASLILGAYHTEPRRHPTLVTGSCATHQPG
ncbi:MAG TPA: beta-ketoacyl-[acyl-carrier-protein] synthase family protein [Anaerolineae bacterium]|nr:beta-ketoacyl-[acyl-carrier-protein] synthase family protein [Anaerolineae bacterium]HOQ98688.1 beta-ketoacyl-[acyl-carrier-protein] synthase family protein [Anaerolineae bacterium]HPL26650.1 beta-ketoacyl-[acyl-carrier-protein] synthase family protein [Anaerolineae bacterium]